MMETTFSLPELLRDRLHVNAEAIAQFCQKWQIAELALFGSVLRHDFRPYSDIDVLIGGRFEGGDRLRMQAELEQQFGRAVDITLKQGLINPFSRAEILTHHYVIYPCPEGEPFSLLTIDKAMQDQVNVTPKGGVKMIVVGHRIQAN